MSAGLTFEVPINTQGGDNAREHHMARDRRQQREIKAVGLVCAAYRPADGCNLGQLLRAMAKRGPLDVRVVRLYTGTRRCDPHNLGSKLKGIIDGLAKVFGIDDGDERIRYIPDQQRAKVAGVRVEVGSRAKVLPWPKWTAEEWRFARDGINSIALRQLDEVPYKMIRDCEAMAAALEKP